jgi:hypothetical protein
MSLHTEASCFLRRQTCPAQEATCFDFEQSRALRETRMVLPMKGLALDSKRLALGTNRVAWPEKRPALTSKRDGRQRRVGLNPVIAAAPRRSSEIKLLILSRGKTQGRKFAMARYHRQRETRALPGCRSSRY